MLDCRTYRNRSCSRLRLVAMSYLHFHGINGLLGYFVPGISLAGVAILKTRFDGTSILDTNIQPRFRYYLSGSHGRFWNAAGRYYRHS